MVKRREQRRVVSCPIPLCDWPTPMLGRGHGGSTRDELLLGQLRDHLRDRHRDLDPGVIGRHVETAQREGRLMPGLMEYLERPTPARNGGDR